MEIYKAIIDEYESICKKAKERRKGKRPGYIKGLKEYERYVELRKIIYNE